MDEFSQALTRLQEQAANPGLDDRLTKNLSHHPIVIGQVYIDALDGVFIEVMSTEPIFDAVLVKERRSGAFAKVFASQMRHMIQRNTLILI